MTTLEGPWMGPRGRLCSAYRKSCNESECDKLVHLFRPWLFARSRPRCKINGVAPKNCRSPRRLDTERAGDFAKRCHLGIADLNASTKQASALRCSLSRLLT